MNQNKSIKSSHVRFGKRTYFFDINVTAKDKKYLRITESQYIEEGKPRKYNSFILFPENVEDFQKNLSEMVQHLE